MATDSPLSRFDPADLMPRPTTLYVAASMIIAEVLLLGWYLAFSNVVAYDLTQYLYPFVWINVAVLAVWRTTTTPTSSRRRWVAGLVAAVYGLVLAYFGGVVAPGAAFGIGPPADGFTTLLSAPPGYGPAVTYSGSLVWAAVVPYKVIGYAALAYLVYGTILDAAGSALTGILGLFSCVSCSWPILASLLSGVTGASGALTGAALGSSYELSTAVFVVTVALLYWRPTRW